MPRGRPARLGRQAKTRAGRLQRRRRGRERRAIGLAQLIVVGTHGKGLVRRILLGSVSRQVLNHAERPVASLIFLTI
jgi:nucleotide-binding universal stress UspA family protein